MKSYTDLEQSKMLSEILPIESADMHYIIMGDDEEPQSMVGLGEYIGVLPTIPCWSLAALLSVLPTIRNRNAEFCKDISCDKWHVYYHGTATLSIIDTNRYENIIDACVEMIIKLHKSNLL